MIKEHFNTELQRGLLMALGEEAQSKNLWLRYRARPEVRMTPTHFMELVQQGRFELTSPIEWEMYEQEQAQEVTKVTKVPEAPPTPPPPAPRQESAPMKQTTIKAKSTTPTNNPEELLIEALKVRKALGVEIERTRKAHAAEIAKLETEFNNLGQEIVRLSTGLVGGSTPPRATPAAPAPVAEAPRKKRRRYNPRTIAFGIRAAIVETLLANGPQTVQGLQQLLVGRYHQDKVRGNLPQMVGDGLITKDDKGVYALAPRWPHSRSGRRVQDDQGVGVSH
jgi:hypothetical protein